MTKTRQRLAGDYAYGLGRDIHSENLNLRSYSQQHYPATRGSVLLRQLLARHPNRARFTLAQILRSMGEETPAAALMAFSMPGMVAVPGSKDIAGRPVLHAGTQMMRGRTKIRLPASLLKRSVPRRAVVLAVHAVLPILDKVEKLARPRWLWLTSPAAQRIIGLMVFLIALPLALPVLGFNLPHAASLFTIAVGLIERDGFAVALGLVLGVASLAFITAKSISANLLKRNWYNLVNLTSNLINVLKTVAKRAARALLRSWFVHILEREPVGAR